MAFLSTLSLRRATSLSGSSRATVLISIHALLAESDAFLPADQMSHQEFLSTLSLRRATFPIARPTPLYRHFYPRSPCGERRIFHVRSFTSKDISIHALLAESDSAYVRVTQRQRISIHALLAESDEESAVDEVLTNEISIHALLAESDEHAYQLVLWVLRFLSTLSLRRATAL